MEAARSPSIFYNSIYGGNMITINNLSKTYPSGKKAVKNVSFEVLSGQVFGFIGSNGAGKTTIIKCITGLHDFEAGEVYVDTKSIKSDPMGCKRTFAYLPDNPDLYEHLKGIEYLNFIADIFDVPSEKRTQLVKKYSQLFEIEFQLGDAIASYSHGMKQKLAIISALIHEPKIIIMDEPFVGLDPKAAFELKNIMKEFCDRGGAIFFSTHVLEVAQKICTNLAIIKDGELIACGTTEDVCGNSSLEDLFLELVEK